MLTVKKDLTATVTLKQGDSDAMPSAGFYVTKSSGTLEGPCVPIYLFIYLNAVTKLHFRHQFGDDRQEDFDHEARGPARQGRLREEEDDLGGY
jgi:hypothetical protein